MKRTFWIVALSYVIVALCLGLLTTTLAAADPENTPKGIPKIQFESTFFDFGHLVAIETTSGVFKFKNVGDGILQVAPPEPSCGCTDARVKPARVGPGESGEISYKIKLDHAMDTTQKHIAVHSNDPKTPDVQLTMQLSYMPLYEFSSSELQVTLSAGKDATEGNFIVTRVDDKPLGIDRLTASQDWISTAFDSSFAPKDPAARVNVTVHRPPGPPAPIDAVVQLWTSNQPAYPVRTIHVTGDVQGEVTATPPKIYWPIPSLGSAIKDYPPQILTKTVELKSMLGNAVEIKSATSSIKGMSIKIVPKEAGKTFDMVMKFDELPRVFTNGIVTVETSLASIPQLEVPLTIAVFK